MTYELSTLQLSTIYDDPVDELPVPAFVDNGREAPGLFLTDGVALPSQRVARLRQSGAVLGVRLGSSGGGGVRVRMSVATDPRALAFWRRVHADPDDPDASEQLTDLGRHRSVAVLAQGRARGVITMQRRRAEKVVEQTLQFDVSATELGDTDVLLLEFEEPSLVVPWFADWLLPESLVGVCVRSLEITPLGDEASDRSLSGVRVRPDGRRVMPARPGFFVVNPGSVGGATLVRLERPAPRKVAAPVAGRPGVIGSLGRLRARLTERKPAAPRAEPPASFEVETVTLSGRTEVHVAEAEGTGAWRLQLPPSDEPVLVRPRLGGRWLVDIATPVR